MESPDSAQPNPPHVGSCSSVPLMSWAVARKTSVPAGETATPGEEPGVPGEEAGALGDPAEPVGVAVVLGVLGVLGVLTVTGVLEAEDAAELVVELQAVNSTAIPASDAQASTCRSLGAFVIPMMSNPFNVIGGSASRVTSTTLAVPPRLERRRRRAATTVRPA